MIHTPARRPDEYRSKLDDTCHKHSGFMFVPPLFSPALQCIIHTTPDQSVYRICWRPQHAPNWSRLSTSAAVTLQNGPIHDSSDRLSPASYKLATMDPVLSSSPTFSKRSNRHAVSGRPRIESLEWTNVTTVVSSLLEFCNALYDTSRTQLQHATVYSYH